MPRIQTNQTNFTAGEWSPRLHGRVDVDNYANAAKALTNAHAVVQGGARRRDGTRFAQAAKNANKKGRLVEFVVSRDIAYMLEFGDLYVRVFSPNGVYTGIEIVSPYTETQAQELDFCQGADTMFLWHSAVFPYRLRRLSSTVWDLSLVPFTVAPFDEQGVTPATTLTLSLATVGAGRTATAGVAAFLPTDVGRNLYSGAGVATITAYTSATVVAITITAAFAAVGIASGAWSLDLSPQGFLISNTKDPVSSIATLFGAQTRAAGMSLSAASGAITITADSPVFVVGDIGKKFYADTGIATITAFTDASNVNADAVGFLKTGYVSGAYGITQAIFRSTDVGSYVRANSGLLLILTVAGSGESATARILTVMTSVIASPPLSWSLETPMWSAVNGYPRTGTLHEQRLWAGGTTRYPQTVWGSRTGLYLDYTKGANDTDACVFTIASNEVNPIDYLTSGRNLVLLTFGGEFTLQGGNEKPITPTNVQIKPQSTHGSKGVRPLNIGKEAVFVQRAGRKVRAMSYDYTVDGYRSPDIIKRAEHLGKQGIVGIAYQQEPDQIIWAWRADGALLSCTFDRDENVDAWSPHYTQGAVEWVASMPNGDSDQVWMLVRRTVNGATVRYIEWMDNAFVPTLTAAPTGYPPLADQVVYGTTVDCGMVFDNALGQSTFAVPHLIGSTVDIVADGLVQVQQVVPGSGNVTISRPSFRTLIGLHFASEIALMTPAVNTPSGSGQAASMGVSQIAVQFLNTIGAQVVDGLDNRVQELSFRQFGASLLDQAPEPFSGLKFIEKLGWELGRSEISIRQPYPLPMHVLSVVRKMTVND